MSLPRYGDPIVINSTPPIEGIIAVKQELIRLRQLTPGQLDEEIRNEAVRWFDEHRLQIPEQSLE